MGYRSTFVTEDVYYRLPKWFVEKWTTINYGEHDDKPSFPLSSKFERKFYSGIEDELFIDIAKALGENTDTYPKEVVVALMHEDGEIDRITITPEKITLQGSLQYDPEAENWQFGNRDKELVIAPKG